MGRRDEMGDAQNWRLACKEIPHWNLIYDSVWRINETTEPSILKCIWWYEDCSNTPFDSLTSLCIISVHGGFETFCFVVRARELCFDAPFRFCTERALARWNP